MRPILALLAAAALGAAAAPAHAQATPADDADLKCMLVIGALVESPAATDQIKTFAPMAFTYYYGKVRGRTPGLDIEGRLLQLVGAMQGSDLKSDAGRCAAELTVLAQETKSLGQKLQGLSAKTTP